MSSLSMCQHILDTSEEQIISILNNNEIPGIIIGKTDTGITIVVEPEDSEIFQNETTSLSMAYFGDAGFILAIMHRGEKVASLHYMWEEELLFQLSEGFVDNMFRFSILPDEKIEPLKKILHEVNRHSFEPDDVNNFIDEITKLYGFAGYEYLDYGFISRHIEDFREQYPGMKFIDDE